MYLHGSLASLPMFNLFVHSVYFLHVHVRTAQTSKRVYVCVCDSLAHADVDSV